MRSSFAYAVCQIGAEPALKEEVARLRPGWRFAFSRPGLITWRCDAPVDGDLLLPAVFARASGASLGRAQADDDVRALAEPLRAAAPLVLQVFERDRPGDEVVYGPLAEAVAARLRAAGPALWAPGTAPRPGDLVLDVIAAPEEPLWVGYHRHGLGRSPHPGGRPPLRLPEEAPSRAWRKLEEALCFSGFPLRAGDVAVEIGSAPGGASYALLQRGLTVVGVDPGAMDARVLAAPRFKHLQVTLAELRREQLPSRVHWLLLDVNLAPQVALHGVRRIVSTLRAGLRGVLFTLKLNDWSMAREVPALLGRVEAMGLRAVRATQLPSNRREICVAAEAGVPGGAS